jgi:hypothetical protein
VPKKSGLTHMKLRGTQLQIPINVRVLSSVP